MLRYLLALLLSVQVVAAPVTVRWQNPKVWSDGADLTQAQIRFAVIHCPGWRHAVPVTGPSATFEIATPQQCRLTLIATKTDASAYVESDFSPPFTPRFSAFNGPTSIEIEFATPTVCTTRCTTTP